jgi:hypothetical protein
MTPTPADIDRATCGKATILVWGQRMPLRLSAPQQQAYELAKVRHYVLDTRPESWLLQAYALWCDASNEPDVHIVRGRQYARVRLDLAGTTLHLPPAAIVEADRRLHDESAQRASVIAGRSYCSSNKVPLDRAEALATWLYTLAREQGQPWQPADAAWPTARTLH